MKLAMFGQRCYAFASEKLHKINLFETERFFLDVYCLEPGQSQKAHAHAGSDKVYAVLEGAIVAQVGPEEQELRAGEAVLAPAGAEHGIMNRSGARAAVLVFMAPKP
jgi:quercetin dioxygenase-like cupin family protein